MLTGYQIEWSPVNHVKESPTNAFGYISFSGEQQDAMMAAEVITSRNVVFEKGYRYVLY